MESEKICAAKEISRTNRGGTMRILFLPLRLTALSFSPFFSQAHVHPATHADTWRRHTKKIAYNCTIFLSIAIFLPSRPLFSRTVHGALPITTYIVFSNNGKILRPHRHFHPLCHLICAFFKGKTKLPARLLMVASGKRSSSFDPWSSVLFPPMDPAFDYSIFFFFPPSIHNSQTLFIIRRSAGTSIHFNVNSREFLFFSFLFSRNDALLPSIAFPRGSRCIIPDPLLCLIN